MSSYYLSIFTFVGISIIGVLGTYLVTGLTGMFSLGQSTLMAVGAYCADIAVVKAGLPVPVAFIIAILITAILAFLIGSVALRLRQDFFALVTFGFGEAIKALLNTSVNLTGGAAGLAGVPMKVTFPIVAICLVAAIFVTYRIKRSNLGRRSLAIRDNELAAEVLGVPTYRHKLTIFVIGSVFAGLAGCLYVFYTTYIEPATFGWLKSAEWIIMVYFGGRGSITGAVVSGLVLLSLPELLRFADEYRTIIYCVSVITILSFRPNGIMGDREFSIKGIIQFAKKLTAREAKAPVRKEDSDAHS